MTKGKQAAEPDAATAEVTTAVRWDDAGMRTSYANVLNVINTREEFSVFFGMNHTLDAAMAGGLVVKLDNRVVMTPHAAKRLSVLLADRVAEYERRFGDLTITA